MTGKSKKTELYSLPGHLIRRLNQVSTSIFMEEMSKAGFDITSVQYAALDTVSRNPGLDQATLACSIAYDRATIGGVVDRLEQKDFLRRVVSRKDRRARELYLTQKGMQAYERVKPIAAALQIRILEGLDEGEREVFLRLLAKAVDAGNEHSRSPLRLQPGS